MFSSTAPILRWSSPKGEAKRRMGRRQENCLISACQDERLKCSVNCCIVRLLIINSTAMTEQNKITIFDALIKPFLCSDALTSEHEEDNLFATAIRQLLNFSLLAQQDTPLGCERYERMTARNGQRNGFKPRTIRTSTGQITLDVPQVRNSQTPFTPIIPGFERGSRIDRALNLAIAEMYLQGVSTRKVAKVMNVICELQVSYAIGKANPLSIMVDTFGTIAKGITERDIIKRVKETFSFKPADIERELNLRAPIFASTTNYGHFGKTDLPWEQLDMCKLAMLQTLISNDAGI